MTTNSLPRLRKPLMGLVGFGLLMPICAKISVPAEVDTKELVITDDSENIPVAFWQDPVTDLRDALNNDSAKRPQEDPGPTIPAMRSQQPPFETLNLNVYPGTPVGIRFSKFMGKNGFKQILINGRWYWSDKQYEPISAELFQQEFNMFLLGEEPALRHRIG